MISARNIEKSFVAVGQQVKVLKGVSVDIKQGEFASIVGRSGSGKSTLLNVLSTLVQPDEGELSYLEKDLRRLPEKHLNQLRQSDFSVIFPVSPSASLSDGSRERTASVHEIVPTGSTKQPLKKPVTVWRESDWPIKQIVCRGNSPAANSRGSPSPGHWSSRLKSCLPTSRPGVWTKKRASRSCSY